VNYLHTWILQGTCEVVSAVNKSRLVDPNLWTVDLLVTTGVTLTAPQIHTSPSISPVDSVKAAKVRSADWPNNMTKKVNTCTDLLLLQVLLSEKHWHVKQTDSGATKEGCSLDGGLPISPLSHTANIMTILTVTHPQDSWFTFCLRCSWKLVLLQLQKEQWLSKSRHICWQHCLNTEDIFGKSPKIHQTIQQVLWPSTENCVASHE